MQTGSSRPKKFLSLVISCFLLAACSSPSSVSTSIPLPASAVLDPASTAASSQPPVIEVQPIEHRIRFSAVGDNLIHNSIYESAKEKAGGEGYDFTYAYENIRHYFADFDVNWINQETLVNNELPASTYPCFSTPGELGQAAYDAGWRVFALSNNHTYDKGSAGIDATRRYWESMPEDVITYGLYTENEDESGIALQRVNGRTIAYVAFTEHTNGIPTPSDASAWVIYTSQMQEMEYKVRKAREMGDIVVVSVHWGVENSHTVIQQQRDLAQSFADWGADVVIGTHPHVIQEMEYVASADGRQVLVAYSLGNFLSAQSEPDQLFGLALSFDFVQIQQPDGSFSPLTLENVKAVPVVTQYEYPGGPRYVNPRTYIWSDYTDELAKEHGVIRKNPSFSKAYIQEVCEKYIPAEFLVLE